MRMKKILVSIAILLSAGYAWGQNNSGSPYSRYGLGLLPDNYGTYTAMGGVSAAMRDNYNINFLNPASYTALDSVRFYFQIGMNGEYVEVSTSKGTRSYSAGQNGSINMAFRVYKHLYASLGFNERSDIGYDLHFIKPVMGDESISSAQVVEGEGGLNDVYLGLAYQLGRLSLGVNAAIVFGKLEERETLQLLPYTAGYYIRTRERNQIHDFLFTLGAQYPFMVSRDGELTLGVAGNFGTYLGAYKTFEAYKYGTTSNSGAQINDEVWDDGHIFYPSRVVAGATYKHKNQWVVSGDYTFQNMSNYKEFGDQMEDFEDYHKVAVGGYYQPDETGRYWWQRNKYMAGGYFTRSHIYLRDKMVKTYGITFGAQMPLTIAYQQLLLGVSFDLGMRGTEQNSLIKEKYVKLRINIAFKELWFAKRKIN